MQLTITSRGLPEMTGFTKRLAGALADENWLAREMGAILVDSTKEHIEQGGTPDGAFRETDPEMAEIEGKGHTRPLIFTRKLQNSMRAVARGAGTVEMGSSLPYAGKALRGGKNYGPHSIEFRRAGKKIVNMWPRPYLGIWGNDIQELIRHIQVRANTGRR